MFLFQIRDQCTINLCGENMIISLLCENIYLILNNLSVLGWSIAVVILIVAIVLALVIFLCRICCMLTG